MPGTLVEADLPHAVTLVTNHDTQPLQAPRGAGCVNPGSSPRLCAADPAAGEWRALGLLCRSLRRFAMRGYTGGDGETYAIEMPVIEQLHELIDARQRFAHGVQTLWFDHPNCIAFSRSGTRRRSRLRGDQVSNGDEGRKRR